MTGTTQLPADFVALEPFVEQWAHKTSSDRDNARLASTPEQRAAFYEAAQPLLGSALAYLDGIPVRELAGKDLLLMELMMGLAHVSIAVEVQREMEPRHAMQALEMPITRSVTDPKQA